MTGAGESTPTTRKLKEGMMFEWIVETVAAPFNVVGYLLEGDARSAGEAATKPVKDAAEGIGEFIAEMFE